MQLFARLKAERDFGRQFKQVICKRADIEAFGGTSSSSTEGTTHTVRKEEQIAFSNWINRFDGRAVLFLIC